MQGRSCGLFNCSQIYYYKYCGLIIQFNVKLTILYEMRFGVVSYNITEGS